MDRSLRPRKGQTGPRVLGGQARTGYPTWGCPDVLEYVWEAGAENVPGERAELCEKSHTGGAFLESHAFGRRFKPASMRRGILGAKRPPVFRRIACTRSGRSTGVVQQRPSAEQGRVSAFNHPRARLASVRNFPPPHRSGAATAGPEISPDTRLREGKYSAAEL
jgi:hypothetical protein